MLFVLKIMVWKNMDWILRRIFDGRMMDFLFVVEIKCYFWCGSFITRSSLLLFVLFSSSSIIG